MKMSMCFAYTCVNPPFNCSSYTRLVMQSQICLCASLMFAVFEEAVLIDLCQVLCNSNSSTQQTKTPTICNSWHKCLNNRCNRGNNINSNSNKIITPILYKLVIWYILPIISLLLFLQMLVYWRVTRIAISFGMYKKFIIFFICFLPTLVF